MLTITRNEAMQVMDALKQAQEEPFYDDTILEESISILEGVLLGPDIAIELLVP